MPARRPTGQLIIPSYVGSPTPEQQELIEESLIESARRKASLKAAREEAQRESARLKAGRNDTSYKKSPMTKAIEEQRRIALGGLTPTTPEEVAAYDLAIKQQPTFTSPAQAYMLQRELERESFENDFPATLLSPPKLASELLSDATKRGLDAGQQVAEEGNISGLLGNIDWRGLLGVLGRPEFLQPGLSPAQAFVNASFAQRQADAASRAAAQAQQLEYDKLQAGLAKESIKAGAKYFVFSYASVRKIFNETQMGMSLLKDYNKIRQIIGEQGTSGAIPFLIDNVRAVANVFGFNLESTARQKVEDLIERVKTKFAGSRVFGRELNKQDHEILAKVLKSPSVLSSDDRIRDAYLALIQEAQTQHAFNMRYLEQMGADTTIFDTPLGRKMTARPGIIATRID